MQPIVTPEEMAAIDRDRARTRRGAHRTGRSCGDAARDPDDRRGVRPSSARGRGQGQQRQRRAGRGARLRARGVRVAVVDAASAEGTRLPAADLVIDAAYGTGFQATTDAPDPGHAPVLAVDIPSGVNGRTGEAGDGSGTSRRDGFLRRAQARSRSPAWARAGRNGSTSSTSGSTCVAPLCTWSSPPTSCSGSRAPTRRRTSGGLRCGSSRVARHDRRGGARLPWRATDRCRLRPAQQSPVPGPADATAVPIEVVRTELPSSSRGTATCSTASGGSRRSSSVRDLAPSPSRPRRSGTSCGIDRSRPSSTATALTALGSDVARYAHPLSVLTPHDGEYERLAGHPPVPDRITAARDLAASTTATVLLKGSTTVVADSEGRVLVSTTGRRPSRHGGHRRRPLGRDRFAPRAGLSTRYAPPPQARGCTEWRVPSARAAVWWPAT